MKHSELNRKRSEDYRKPEEEESFLGSMNDTLLPLEQSFYTVEKPEHPFLFIFGLPRSGTTLLSQLIAHCLDVGYINNLSARFWRAPVTGIRFAQAVLDTDTFKAFDSHFGATESLADIHEFGYFWREWLKKDSFEHIKNARDIEPDIDWQGLRKTLANMQHQFGRPMIFKNIFGSYHISRINEELGQTLWIYIERDPLDTAVSILKAREKYFDDPDHWWSYVPPEYDKIIDLDYHHQIAGQVHYLKSFYYREMEHLDQKGKNILRITYSDLCEDPAEVLMQVREKLSALYDCEVSKVQDPPELFEYSTYDHRTEEKKRFESILNEFENSD